MKKAESYKTQLQNISRHSHKVDIVEKKGRWAIINKNEQPFVGDVRVWYTDTNFVIRGSKRYRHHVYMLGNICCKQCTVAHTQQGLLAIVYHTCMYTYGRAYLRGTVVHKYMPIFLQLYMMSKGDLVYSLHLTQLQSIVVQHTLQMCYEEQY